MRRAHLCAIGVCVRRVCICSVWFCRRVGYRLVLSPASSFHSLKINKTQNAVGHRETRKHKFLPFEDLPMW